MKEYKPKEKRFWAGHLWSRGYFFRSVGSTTDDAVEFYIKISQDRGLREKYYKASDMDGDRVADDPYIEHLRDKLDRQRRSLDNKQKTLDTFTVS